jgi:hypothetical protein
LKHPSAASKKVLRSCFGRSLEHAARRHPEIAFVKDDLRSAHERSLAGAAGGATDTDATPRPADMRRAKLAEIQALLSDMRV